MATGRSLPPTVLSTEGIQRMSYSGVAGHGSRKWLLCSLNPEQRRHVELRCQVAHGRVRRIARISDRRQCVVEGVGVLVHTAARVVAGDVVRELERPVARL